MGFFSFVFVSLLFLWTAKAEDADIQNSREPKSNPFLALQHLGIPNIHPGATVTVEKGKRKGESPIYYIKLPPMPYYFVQNTLPTYHTPTYPFVQVPVDFTNNGRPEQVYYWNDKGPPSQPASLWPTPTADADIVSNNIFPYDPQLGKPSKVSPTKPLINLTKQYFYNGRPANIYVWKPRRHSSKTKFRHPMFTHFNY